jgi:uncharacterized membrane protein
LFIEAAVNVCVSAAAAHDLTSRRRLQAALVATLLCSLVAGFLFAFAAVVMPGIRSLDDAGFIRAFQVIDRVIQKNQPLSSSCGSDRSWPLSLRPYWECGLTGLERLLMIAAVLVYLLGVQLPTMIVNITLNNQLQQIDVTTLTDTTTRQAREAFESRWNRWNVIRTVCAGVATVLFLLLVLRI